MGSTGLHRLGRIVFEVPRRFLMVLIRGYQIFLSPWLGSNCRFFPSCSAYALEALSTHGAVGGTYLTAARLLRCHPWCKGGHDPVPGDLPRLFSSIGCPSTRLERPSPKRDVS